MGEMADMYNEYCDPFDEDPPEVTCKYCGCRGLEWGDLNGRWVLYDCDGNIHKCPEISADELAKVWR